MAVQLTRRGFFAALPIRSRIMLMGFIFFIFAPASILFISPFKYDRSILCLATYALMGGLTAIGYAYSFLKDYRMLAAVVPAQALWFIIPHWFPQDFRAGFTPSMHGALLVAMIVTAYVLFIVFFQNEGIRTIRMQTELALARQIHTTLIPPIMRRTGRLELFGHSVAGAEMGGDLIDVVERDGTADVLIADVSGHGIKAGVIMAVVKSAFRTRQRSECELDALYRDVNAVVCELAGAGMFVTAATLRFPPEGCAIFCGAGHGPVLHYRARTKTIEFLESQSPPLGVLKSEPFVVCSIECSTGDVLLMMTDGLFEVFSSKGLMLGQEPIAQLFQRAANQPLPALYESIMSAVRSHGAQSDDQTLLLIKIA
jgi:serine phosphatase RsbU (regulator of sigma subunit)